MIDRGIIKWQPFNSCFNGKRIIEDIKKDKDYVSYPSLSEDQLEMLEKEIIEAYNLGLNISLIYYYDGKLNNLKGKIKYLNNEKKILYLNNKNLYLKQILKIERI